MAVGAAFGMELKEMTQTFRVAERKPLRSLLIRQPEDLCVSFNRAHDSGLYRSLMFPMRADIEESAEDLLQTIFSDIQYLSDSEPEMLRAWIKSAEEPLQELRSRGLEIFSIQDCCEGFVGKPGEKQLLENWTTAYYLLVLEHSCFSSGKVVHRFHDGCAKGINTLHEWLRQEQDGTEVKLYLFANELLVKPPEGTELSYCNVCFPNGPTGEYLTAEYVKRISGLRSEDIGSLVEKFDSSGRADA
jgi:hypothetical protein